MFEQVSKHFYTEKSTRQRYLARGINNVKPSDESSGCLYLFDKIQDLLSFCKMSFKFGFLLVLEVTLSLYNPISYDFLIY